MHKLNLTVSCMYLDVYVQVSGMKNVSPLVVMQMKGHPSDTFDCVQGAGYFNSVFLILQLVLMHIPL